MRAALSLSKSTVSVPRRSCTAHACSPATNCCGVTLSVPSGAQAHTLSTTICGARLPEIVWSGLRARGLPHQLQAAGPGLEPRAAYSGRSSNSSVPLAPLLLVKRSSSSGVPGVAPLATCAAV